MQWLTALDLEVWADRIAFRSDLPELIADLIRASAPDITSFRFPAGDSAQVHGFDGRLTARGVPPYVPDGHSVWEFGTSQSYLKKANDDYEARSNDPKDANPEETTFVFVTPRRWTRTDPTIDRWQDEKRKLGRWKDVRALDAIALENWLNQCEAVAARFAREVLHSVPAVSARSISEFWSEFSSRFSPPLTEDVLLIDRQEQSQELLQQLGNGPAAYLVQADSPEEVIAFAVAAIRRAEPAIGKYLEARAIVLDTEHAARDLSVRENLVFLPRASAIPLAGALGQRNPTIVPLGRDDGSRRNALVLKRPSSANLAEALRTMGLGEEQSHQLARVCGRSVTVLARRIPSGSAVRPEWDRDRQLVPALLLGSWDSASASDRAVATTVAGTSSYEAFEDSILPYLRQQDPPLEREGSVWKIRAPVDAFVHLAYLIGNTDLQRFATTAKSVFAEIDPALDLPPDERPYASLSGRVLSHSRWIRDGIATTLLLMSVMHTEASMVTPPDPAAFVAALIEDIPGLAADYRILASLEAQLPILMEAAPRPLLRALGRLLEGDGEAIRPIFKDSGTSLFGTYSPHTGVLWALEVVAWDEYYISDAALLLARLARVDPGGKLANRPLNCLREIFLPWHPSTNASLEQRIAVLDRLIAAEPEVTWKLLLLLMPESHGIASPTAHPRLHEFGASERENLTYGLVWRGYSAIVERALRLADYEPAKWAVIIVQVGSLSVEDRALTLDTFEQRIDSLRDADNSGQLWTSLNELVNRHRAFSEAEWAMSSEDVDRLTEIARNFEPADLVARTKWLFDDHLPDLPEKDIDDRIKAVELRRLEAMRTLISTTGVHAVSELAKQAKYPAIVASVAGLVVDDTESVEQLINATRVGSDPSPFAVALSAAARNRFCEAWSERISARFRANEWSSELVVKLLLYWPDDRTTWDFVNELGSETEQSYWRSKPVWPIQACDDARTAIDRYSRVGRYMAAIEAISHSVECASTADLLALLDRAISEINASSEAVTPSFRYDLRNVFKALRQRADVSRRDIAGREYAYLPVFRHTDEPLTLHSLLAEDPSLFVSVLCDVFKPESGEPREPTPEAVARARMGYELLSEFDTVPGIVQGVVQEDELSEWINAARVLAAANDRSTLADEYIGQFLARSPIDVDGAWPHMAVCNVLEHVASEAIERGVLIGRFNMRGVTVRGPFDGGEQERVLAREARDWAKKRSAWPRVHKMLVQLSTRWDREAEQEDIRARQTEMRFE